VRSSFVAQCWCNVSLPLPVYVKAHRLSSRWAFVFRVWRPATTIPRRFFLKAAVTWLCSRTF
jgi:hypothetical protein